MNGIATWPEGIDISLVGGGPGAWDLLTLRALARLEAAEVIIADHLGPAAQLPQFLDLSHRTVIDASKLPYGRQMAQERINDLLIEHASQGHKVVRLKGGDPFIFGRGFEELDIVTRHGFSVEVVPGLSSAISVPGLDHIALTIRGLVHNVSIISGHVPPGHPSSLNNWEALSATGGTLVIIMGVKNGPAIAAELIRQGRKPDTPVAIIQEGSTLKERSFRTTLEGLEACIRNNAIQPPAVIIIGEVAGKIPGQSDITHPRR